MEHMLAIRRYFTSRIQQVSSPNSRALRLFLLTYFAYATLYATRKPFSVVKTRVQEELKLSTNWLGLIDTCFLGSYAVGQILIPSVLTRLPLSSSKLLLILYSGSGLVSTFFGFSTSAYALCLLWIANGLLHSAVFPILVTCVSSHFSAARRGQVMGTWTTSQQLGATLATLFAAYVAERLGWRSVFIISGFFTLGVGIFLFVNLRATIPEVPVLDPIKCSTPVRTLELAATTASHHHHQSPAEDTGLDDGEDSEFDEEKNSSFNKPPVPPPNRSFASLMDIPDIKSVSLCYFCIKCVRYSLLFWLPYYLATELQYSADVAGYASIMFDLGGIAGGVLAGQFADRLCSGRRIFVASLTCLGSATSLMLFAWAAKYSTLVALSLMTLVGFTVAGSDSIIGGSAASDLCDRAGLSSTSALSSTSGIVNGFGSVGAVLQAYLTAHISEAYGWFPLYSMLALTSLGGAACLIIPTIHEARGRRAILM